MRLKGLDILGNLPKGHDGKNHHLWDVAIGGSNLRDILNTLWQNNKVHFTWREFCERLGNEIYRQYKEETGGVSVKFRILGDTEYYSKPDKTGQASDFFIPITRTGNVAEWIIVGKLKAVTPFYFGVQQSFGSNQTASADDVQGRDTFAEGLNAEISEQTSFRILLDKEGRYRIPRSLMRGALRRDLNTAFGGSGCTMDLGGAIPCVCPVCIIMRRITIKDSRSDCIEPPDMRYRIRMNPETSAVDEGALFDMEIGPEDITFPFVLRYRGEGELPSELWSILQYWNDGMAWLGGSGSTGKGRFSLEGIKIYQWDLNGDGLTSYIDEKGLRGNELDIKNDKLPSGLKPPIGLPDNPEIYEPYRKYLKPQWQEVTYTMKIASPLLSADTIAALLDPDNRDSIAYRKRVWDAEKKELAHKFTIKGETIRGIVRTAVGKQNGLLDKEHKECDCELCMIFGNEHEAGKIRFDDLEVKTAVTVQPSTSNSAEEPTPGPSQEGNTKNPLLGGDLGVGKLLQNANECKHIDHVAIDRFTGGAVDKKKFDTYPIAGSPNKPIILQGTFWMKKDLSNEEKELIGDALLDIKQGLYPIGGKTGIGYGWVSDLVVRSASRYFSDLAEGRGKTEAQEAPSEVCPSYNKPRPSPALPDGKNSERFYPHYFLEPDKYVNREPFLPGLGHEKFNHGLLTGKIRCNLKTLTPLIIPDSMYEYEFCNDAKTIQVRTLCNLLVRDIEDKISLAASPDSVDWLNELLKKPNLYDILKKPDSDLPEDILELDARTQTRRTSGFNMSGESGIYVRILNCRILEKWYLQKVSEISEISRHKSYPFFRINDHFQIPGSETKGAVSSVYEAITNSCFRVMDEQVRLSWRMKAEGLSKILKKGRIVKDSDGNLAVEIYEKSARLPFYDNDKAFELDPKQINGEESLTLWVKEFLVKVSLVEPRNPKQWEKTEGIFSKSGQNSFNVKFTVNREDQYISREVMESEKETYNTLPDSKNIKFWFKKSQYRMASINKPADITGWSEENGYLKVTGPSKVEVGTLPVDEDESCIENGIPGDWKIIRINGEKEEGDKKIKIKVFRCKQGNNLYTMSKWCETFFYKPFSDTKKIHPHVLNQYNRLIEKYRDNPQKPPPVFRSLPVRPNPDEVISPPIKDRQVGDLVYVVLNDKNLKTATEVKEIFPVYISRTMDENVLGVKMKNLGQGNLRPCECETDEDTSHPETPCPACRLFGTTSYKGRVRFGFASLINKHEGRVGKEKDSAGYRTLPLLEKPRPTWSMPDKSCKVPGRKFYVHHNGWEKEEKNRNENNRTVEYLGKDNAFTFDVFFENLEKWELGLLLYSLELEPENNLAHKMGMAKAHGFGSTRITINNIFFRVNPIMYKMVNGSRCKNRLIDVGYAKLQEWDGAGKEWYDIPRIQKLRKLLKYEKENERKVEYTGLEGKDGFPGYNELGDYKNWSYRDRVVCLTTPWSPWHPHATPKDDKQESKSETRVTITSNESISHKKDQRKHTPKSKIHLSNKHSGIIKSFEKNGEIVVAKENGGDIHVWYYEKTVLNVGQKIKFGVEQGAMFTKIYDVEIVR